MLITRKSMISGTTRSKEIDITEDQFAAYSNGMHIQNAMPDISASDREFIMTGVTDDEWDEVFGEDDE